VNLSVSAKNVKFCVHIQNGSDGFEKVKIGMMQRIHQVLTLSPLEHKKNQPYQKS
jgi:hypothetical protein